jgi:uncharacterized protein YbjT (DUF2867 family)
MLLMRTRRMQARPRALLAALLAMLACVSFLPAAQAATSAPTRPLLVLAGASGKTGREVLVQAARSGWRVRALTSDLARARKDLGALYRYGEWQQVDLTDPTAVQAAMQGADYVVTAVGAHGFQGTDIPERVDFLSNSRLIDAAAAARVRHFVFISSSTAGTHKDQAKAAVLMNVRFWKTRAEEQLRASGLKYTVVGPGGLTLEPARKLGLRILPREQYSSTDVSRADVARVAIDALTNPGADGKSFALINDKGVGTDAWKAQLVALPADRPTGGETAALDQLTWMAGHWASITTDGARVDEVWLPPAGGLMLGMNRYVPAGKHGLYENLRIETRPDGRTMFVGWPQDQAPTDFTLTSASASRVSFFNLAHDFPQGIHYWREGDELLARVDGIEKGAIRSLEYRFQRYGADRPAKPH